MPTRMHGTIHLKSYGCGDTRDCKRNVHYRAFVGGLLLHHVLNAQLKQSLADTLLPAGGKLVGERVQGLLARSVHADAPVAGEGGVQGGYLGRSLPQGLLSCTAEGYAVQCGL